MYIVFLTKINNLPHDYETIVDTINTTTSTSYKTNNIILIINVILRLWYDYNLGMLHTNRRNY